uniref:Uncharacterized protein n=1 Tax=Noctiluca scintillans TaxID=2966 RepID=A0A7S1AEU8_NOCSC|mmetsp:Transcript_43501/g.114780  ORF Transcript_43501/g.114780 Transcript_43501/m.114780 type:complete len:148 (+) Transcript_43501:37-480(+)
MSATQLFTNSTRHPFRREMGTEEAMETASGDVFVEDDSRVQAGSELSHTCAGPVRKCSSEESFGWFSALVHDRVFHPVDVGDVSLQGDTSLDNFYDVNTERRVALQSVFGAKRPVESTQQLPRGRGNFGLGTISRLFSDTSLSRAGY